MGKKEMIGIRIRTMRKSRRMTQEDLAKAINQSPSSITMYETGRRAPDYETLEALADIFNVPLSALVADDKPIEEHTRSITSRIISGGVERMPAEKQQEVLKVLQTIYADYFKEESADDSEL